MCGIAGIFGQSSFISSERIKAALTALNHRGPDANGCYNFQGREVSTTLLHTRLSIIDLASAANQPFKRHGLSLVFNGEIYNYLEIAKELESKGVQLSTRSDTEVLLEAYHIWGESCLNKLEGMWAFAIFHELEEKLFIARDRFGEKPFFFHRNKSAFFFSSEVKALIPLLGFKPKINYNHVKRYLTNGFRSLFKRNETFFEGVHEVPRASYAILDTKSEKITFKTYWKLEYKPQNISIENSVEGVREKLKKSLDIRMRADVPFAFCLSGGVDSTALVSLASKSLNRSIHTFSIIDKDTRYDERENIEATIKYLNCDSHLVETSKLGFIERMQKLVRAHDAPVPTISYYVHSFLSEAIQSHGYKMVISGTGADEIFTGYYDHYAFWLAQHVEKENFPHLLNEWKQGYGKWVNNPLLQDPMLFYKNPKFREHLFQNRSLFNSYLHNACEEEFSEESYTDELLRNRMMNELFNEVVPVILRADDMNSMAFSLENRSPFLDKSLVEFCYTIPSEFLIQNGLQKWLLRDSMKGIMPEKVRIDNCKKGFNASILSLIDINDDSTKDFLLSDSEIFTIIKRDSVESFLSNNLQENSFSKFLFSFISAKTFIDSYNA